MTFENIKTRERGDYMNLRKAAIFGVIVAGAVVLGGCKTGNQAPGEAVNLGDASGGVVADVTVVTWDGGGFSPSELKIKAGGMVTVSNTAVTAVQLNSDPHPTHTLFPELNLGAIPAGASKSFKMDQAGTFTYHNHLSPSQKGTIVVE